MICLGGIIYIVVSSLVLPNFNASRTLQNEIKAWWRRFPIQEQCKNFSFSKRIWCRIAKERGTNTFAGEELRRKYYLKEREHMLQRQLFLVGELSPRSRRKEIDASNKRQSTLSAASLSLPDIWVTASRSNSFSSHCGGRPVRSYSLIPPSSLSMSSHQLSPPRSRNKLFPDSASGLGNQSQLSVSLPDKHGATGKIGGKKPKIGGELQCNTKASSCEEMCSIDDWEKLGKCRYLRTSSAVWRSDITYDHPKTICSIGNMGRLVDRNWVEKGFVGICYL